MNTINMKVKEFIEFINNNPSDEKFLCLTDVDWRIQDGDLGTPERVASKLEIDNHRWFSTAVDVYKLNDGFVGVRGCYQSFSEMQSWEDVGYKCHALEYEEIPSVTYKPVE